MRGDLQEGNGCASRCQSLYFRAHKRHFCALLPFGTLVFGHFEHKIEVFVLFWPSGPSFSGVSSTKSGFLCSFTKLDVGVGALSRRQRHRRTCGAVAPAQPLCHLPSPVAAYRRYRRCCRCSPLHLRSRRICAAAVPSAVACSRLPPVPPVLPLLAAAPAEPILPLTLPPLHLRSRCTCAAAAPAQPLYLPSRRICAAAVPSAVACNRLPPVLPLPAAAPTQPILPLTLPPLHLRSRCAICRCLLQ